MAAAGFIILPRLANLWVSSQSKLQQSIEKYSVIESEINEKIWYQNT